MSQKAVPQLCSMKDDLLKGEGYCFWLCVIQVQFLLTVTESPFYLLFLVVCFILDI